MNHEVTIRNIWITMSSLCNGTGMALELFDGDTAMCDGQKMYIPRKWVYSVDPEIQEILLGITVHEAMGHGRYTDFKIYQEAAATLSAFGKSVLNIFEDIYVETQAAKAKPGAAAELAKMVTKLQSTAFFGHPKSFAAASQSNPANLLVSGLLNICRSELLVGQEEPLAENVRVLRCLLGDAFGGLWDRVWEVAKAASDSKSTADSVSLTRGVLALIGDLAKDDARPESGESKGDSGGGKQLAQAAKSILQTEHSAMPETEISVMASQSVSTQARGGGSPSIRERSSSAVRPLSGQALTIATSVRSISDALQDALVVQTRSSKLNRLVGRRLNGRILPRVRLGDARVFVHKQHAEGLDVAVGMLVDDSISMGHMRLWTDGTCFGLGDILDEFDIPTEIALYSETLAYAKYFEQDWSSFKKQQSMPDASGGTLTGAALELFLGRMACRSEERRLVILKTDGSTADNDMDRLESAYAEAQHQGIEIASVMLGRVIPKIEMLAEKFGFDAVTCSQESDLARYTLNRILNAI